MSADLLAVHRQLLEQWRTAMNLVGPGGLDAHYADSERGLAGLANLATPTGRWADLGSGAGFPGIPFIARFPHVEVELVESRVKRAAFLTEVLGSAHVPASRARVVRGRVEDLPAAAYDGLLARAFAPPEVVLDHAERLLVPDGVVVLFLTEAQPLPRRPGFDTFHVEHYRVDQRALRTAALRWAG